MMSNPTIAQVPLEAPGRQKSGQAARRESGTVGLFRRARGRLLLGIFLALALAGPGRASALVADLSRHLVAITTGFAGTDVLLFGAIDEPGDIVVVVRGPMRPHLMHRKTRVAGIWVNTASMTFEDVPSFYSVATSRPLDEIASPEVIRREQLDARHTISLPRAKASANVEEEWRAALIRNKQRQSLYPRDAGKVSFSGPQLFRSDVFFPANVPTGAYQVRVYLLRDKHVISAQTTPLIVSKIGAEAEIFDFAHDQAALYGIIAIVLALLAGWLAHVAFRRS